MIEGIQKDLRKVVCVCVNQRERDRQVVVLGGKGVVGGSEVSGQRD